MKVRERMGTSVSTMVNGRGEDDDESGDEGLETAWSRPAL